MSIFFKSSLVAALLLLTITGTTWAATASKAKVDNKQTMIKDVLPLFIKVFGKNPTESEKAWWRKRITCGEIKTEASLISSMQFHKSKGVRKGSDAICGQKPA